jgi:molybdopterin-guanine dinucleotide biosynthesis protein A
VALKARLTAVVLAGGPHDAVAALAPGAANKAFVPIARVTLVARTIASLRASRRVGRIIVVAPGGTHGDAALAGSDEIRADGLTMTESLRSGTRGLAPGDLVLVCASDLPILSAEALDEFVDLAERSGADIVYACVERATHERRFPAVPHTWARLRDGTYCGGGCAALRPRALGALEKFLGRLGAARKNPLQLASVFGARILVRYALGLLTVAEAERRGSALVGVPVAAAVCTFAEIAVNVDRPSDVALAERLIAAEPASPDLVGLPAEMSPRRARGTKLP